MKKELGKGEGMLYGLSMATEKKRGKKSTPARIIPMPAIQTIVIMSKDKAPIVAPPKKRPSRAKKPPSGPVVTVCPTGTKTKQLESERAFNRRIAAGLETQAEEIKAKARAARKRPSRAAKAPLPAPLPAEVPGTVLESFEQIVALCRAASWECWMPI